MSQADELLNSLTAGGSAGSGSAEGHIVIGADRYITVPDGLKKIGVQYDHNIETLIFDCPRYWDGLDMSKMRVYVNYMRPDESLGYALCENVTVDSSDSDIMHFSWTISGHVTEFAGVISFLVCIKNVNSDGEEENHWNSELNTDLYISTGLKCQNSVLQRYPDIITQLLTRMETVEGDNEEWKAATLEELTNHLEENEKTALSYMESAATSASEAEASATAAAKSASEASESADRAESAAGVYISTDIPGDWQVGGTIPISSFYRITYGNGVYVGHNYNSIYYSTDGITWTIGNGVGTSYYLNNVLFLNGKFLAMGYSAKTYISENGIDWTETNNQLSSGLTRYCTYCVFDGEKYVIWSITSTGGSGEQESILSVYESVDGITWVDRESVAIFDDIATSITGMLYINGMYMSWSQYGSIIYSYDNTTFNIIQSLTELGNVNSVVYGLDKFIATGSKGDAYSYDGINWHICDLTAEYEDKKLSIDSVIFLNDKFIGRNNGKFYCSLDGITWTLYTEIEGLTTSGPIVYDGDSKLLSSSGNNTYYADINCGSLYMLSSQAINVLYNKTVDKNETYYENLETRVNELETVDILSDSLSGWTAANGISSEHTINDVAYGNGRFVAVTNAGNTYYSLDGETWTTGGDIGTASTAITYGNGKFVAIVGGTQLSYSTDGVTWTGVSGFTSTATLNDITYGDGKFIVAGVNGVTYYSTDGITWTAGGNISSVTVNHITYGNGVYVTTGTGGSIYLIYYSTDGVNWRQCYSHGLYEIFDIAYGNGKFVCVGEHSSYRLTLYSIDGIKWLVGNDAGSNIVSGCHHISYGDGMFLASSTNSPNMWETLCYSVDGIDWVEVSGVSTKVLNTTYANGRFVTVGTADNTGYIDIIKQTENIDDVVLRLNNEMGEYRRAKIINRLVAIPSASWTASTEYSGYGYEFTQTIEDYYDPYPEWFLKPLSGYNLVPTEAEQTAFGLIAAMKLDISDTSAPKLKFYAATQPSTDILVLVKGVK